jgi:hypothetical protein
MKIPDTLKDFCRDPTAREKDEWTRWAYLYEPEQRIEKLVAENVVYSPEVLQKLHDNLLDKHKHIDSLRYIPHTKFPYKLPDISRARLVLKKGWVFVLSAVDMVEYDDPELLEDVFAHGGWDIDAKWTASRIMKDTSKPMESKNFMHLAKKYPKEIEVPMFTYQVMPLELIRTHAEMGRLPETVLAGMIQNVPGASTEDGMKQMEGFARIWLDVFRSKNGGGEVSAKKRVSRKRVRK